MYGRIGSQKVIYRGSAGHLDYPFLPSQPKQSTTDDPNNAQLDFGDAPDTYQTLLANDGARHTVVPGVCLGRTVDAETDGQPGPAANGDDLDEDGVVFTSSLSPGEPVTVEVTASVQGYLSAWVSPKRTAWMRLPSCSSQ